MSSAAASAPRPLLAAPLRPFVGPVLDLLLIGGGLSLLVVPLLVSGGAAPSGKLLEHLPWFLLLSNGAHFASSTVRLYMKPGARQDMPFLTLGLPLVSLAVVAACLAWPAILGMTLVKLYLTWSPYHYAAQAYGIAVVYGFRSGTAPAGAAKKLLWWASMPPFFHAALAQPGIGASWLLPETWLAAPAVSTTLAGLVGALRVAAFAAPVGLAAWLALKGRPLPLISVLALIANAAWWILLPFWNAFVWATIFHGLQYLTIVTVFHARDREALAPGAHAMSWHVATFYAACVGLGWLLFQVLPEAGLAMGFGSVESVLVVVAAINIHHFIVDAFIWRLKPGDGNRRIAAAGPAGATSA